jgi:putative aldouronate transport system permease protein
MHYKPSLGAKVFDIGNILFLGVLALTMLYPFIYTAVLSFSSASGAAAGGFHIWPQQWSLTSYQMVFRNPEILAGYLNSLLRVGAGTLLSLLLSSMAAYALTRESLPHRRLWAVLLLVSMLFHAGLVPVYLWLRDLHLIDNRLVLVLPMAVTAFNVFILRNFFSAIPQSLGEMARIDGAGEWTIFFRLYLPLSGPALATVGLWCAVMHWNSWFDGMIYIEDNTKQVLPVFLQRIVVENNTEMIAKGLVNPNITEFTPATIKAATIIVTVLPILFVYPFLQRFFTKGIMLGSVKE